MHVVLQWNNKQSMIFKKSGHLNIACAILANGEFALVTSLELKLKKLVCVSSFNRVLENN